MSKEPSYFLVPATSGLCIQPSDVKSPFSASIFTAELDGEPKQQWYIEQGKDRTIAFRNARNGDYLRSTNNEPCLGSKRYWVLEPSNTPNAFRIKLHDNLPVQFLCNTNGKYLAENLITQCSDSPHNLQTTLWYIHDYDSWKASKDWPTTRPKSSSSELDAKENSIKEKQQRIEQKEKELAQKQIELAKKQQDAERREREALEFEQEAKIKQDEASEMKQELEAERKSMRATTAKSSTTNGDDNQWLQRFARLQERLETAHKEIERLRIQPDESQNETIADLRRELKQAQRDATEHKAAYTALREKVEAREPGAEMESNIKARRLHTPLRESEAASVGERWAPPGFRAGRDTAITRGEVRPIAMPREFSHLARLQ